MKPTSPPFRKKRFLFVTFFSGLLLLCCALPPAAEAAKSPSCVTSRCHDGMGKEKYVHGPAATGDCTFCHEPVGDHEFKPIQDVANLCYQCHEQAEKKKSVHPPVQEGLCTECHDPHQSPNKFQLRAAGEELCFLCHDKYSLVGKQFVHSPVAFGGCTSCHDPHQSDSPRMLIAEGNDVCFACHMDKAEEAQTKKFAHAPVADACVNCHSPHSTDHEYNLIADPNQELCFLCHPDKQEQVKNAAVKHGGLATKRKCLACHEVHYSDNAKQLKMAPMKLCLSCHSEEYDRGGDHLANMAEVLENNKSKHGPILEGDCSGCHDPHGSDNFRILRANFPPVFYSGYDPKNYELCFMCHEKDLASEEWTTTMTGFRNGKQNLHYVHVHKTVKGRTCRACHDAHATNNPRHIRDSVPFGNWSLPVGYTKTETGGQCSPGCHQTFRYDREKPVDNRE